MSSSGRERELTSPLDEHQQQLNPKEATYERSEEALLPVLNVDQKDNGLYPHKMHISSLSCIYYGSYPIKDLKNSTSTVGDMYATRKISKRDQVPRDVRKRAMGTKYKDKDWNVGHLCDYKFGGTNYHIDNFTVQNTNMNSVEGTKSAIDNRLEKQLKSEHSNPVYEIIIICLDPKIEDSAETIRPASFLWLEHFVPALPLNNGAKAEWMAARIYNPEPKEMKRLPFHPRRKHSELYEYDFGAKNGGEAKLLRKLAKLLGRYKRPEGNNSIEQLEEKQLYRKKLETLIGKITKKLHKAVADEFCQIFELPNGMKESEGKAVLKALFQAEEPPAVLHIYTSNSNCFAADREDTIQDIFAKNSPDYTRKKIEDLRFELERWERIELAQIELAQMRVQREDHTGIDTAEKPDETESHGMRRTLFSKIEDLRIELKKWESINSKVVQRGDDSGIGTAENTTNAEDEGLPPSVLRYGRSEEAKSEVPFSNVYMPKAPDVALWGVDRNKKQASKHHHEPTERDRVGLGMGWTRSQQESEVPFSNVYIPKAPDVELRGVDRTEEQASKHHHEPTERDRVDLDMEGTRSQQESEVPFSNVQMYMPGADGSWNF